jgi:hypothetical protein
MAMELFVFSDNQLNSTLEWQASIGREGYQLLFVNERPLNTLKGFLPVLLRDTKTGFECSHWLPENLMREIPDVNFGHDWKYLLTFRWGGDFDQLQAAWMAATAYASATDGVIFDEEQGKMRTPAEAREIVQEIEHGMPAVEAILRDLKNS